MLRRDIFEVGEVELELRTLTLMRNVRKMARKKKTMAIMYAIRQVFMQNSFYNAKFV